jgi:hypothetical protein
MSAPCKIGDRIRLTAPLADEYPPPGLPAGLEGTVDWVGQWESELTRQVGVRWDNGRRLILLDGDSFEVIPTETFHEPRGRTTNARAQRFADPTGFPCELDTLP